MRFALAAVLLAACGGDPDESPPDASPPPMANPARGIADEQLVFDVTALTGTAKITFEPGSEGATLEVGDLAIDSVSVDAQKNATTLDLALPAGDAPVSVDVAFHYKTHTGFQGASTAGYTFLWPYFCGNLFPCHSQPRDGTTLSLWLNGIPAGKTAVFPTTIASEAPSYQLAWSIDSYTELPLGTTTAGTQVSVWYRTGELAAAQQGTAHLVAAFDWLEKTIGPYRFGNKVGSVSVHWGPGAYGGMEHHPYWHVSSADLGNEDTNVHEASHGWFGDGIRLGCWEDFVLSEGTVSYLAAHALEVVAPTVGAQDWTNNANELMSVPGTAKVWPQSCDTVDVIKDDLFTDAPYMRGAFFYRAVALKIGADKVDQALHAFYMAHAGQPAHMSDMLDTIKSVTGYDAAACAQLWLEGTTTPTPGPCP